MEGYKTTVELVGILIWPTIVLVIFLFIRKSIPTASAKIFELIKAKLEKSGDTRVTASIGGVSLDVQISQELAQIDMPETEDESSTPESHNPDPSLVDQASSSVNPDTEGPDTDTAHVIAVPAWRILMRWEEFAQAFQRFALKYSHTDIEGVPRGVLARRPPSYIASKLANAGYIPDDLARDIQRLTRIRNLVGHARVDEIDISQSTADKFVQECDEIEARISSNTMSVKS